VAHSDLHEPSEISLHSENPIHTTLLDSYVTRCQKYHQELQQKTYELNPLIEGALKNSLSTTKYQDFYQLLRQIRQLTDTYSSTAKTAITLLDNKRERANGELENHKKEIVQIKTEQEKIAHEINTINAQRKKYSKDLYSNIIHTETESELNRLQDNFKEKSSKLASLNAELKTKENKSLAATNSYKKDAEPLQHNLYLWELEQKAHNTFLTPEVPQDIQDQQLIPVSGDNNDCGPRAILTAAHYNPNTREWDPDWNDMRLEIEVQNIRSHLRGIPWEGGQNEHGRMAGEHDMLELGDEPGAELAIYLEETGLIGANRDIIVTDRHSGIDRETVIAGDSENPRPNPIRIFLDYESQHFYAVDSFNTHDTTHTEVSYPTTTPIRIEPNNERDNGKIYQDAPTRQRIPWNDNELKDLVHRVHTLKTHDPRAKLTQAQDGNIPERLQTHRLSPDEWKKVRTYIKQQKIKSTSPTYSYLQLYHRSLSTTRKHNAAKKQGKTPEQYDKDVKKSAASRQGKTLYQYNRDIKKSVADRQGKTLSQYYREEREAVADRQGKTLSQYNRDAYNRHKTNMRNPEYRRSFFERRFQRQQEKYIQTRSILTDQISQAKTPKQTQKLQQDLTTLQKEWETSQKTNQAKHKELEGLLKTQENLDKQLTNQELDTLTLEHIQLHVDNTRLQIEECFNWLEQSDLNSNPETDEFHQN